MTSTPDDRFLPSDLDLLYNHQKLYKQSYLEPTSSPIVLHLTISFFSKSSSLFFYSPPHLLSINFTLLLSNSFHILPTTTTKNNYSLSLSLLSSFFLCIYYFLCHLCSKFFILSCIFTLIWVDTFQYFDSPSQAPFLMNLV